MESKLMAPFIISILSITILIQADAAPEREAPSTGRFAGVPSMTDVRMLWDQRENLNKMWETFETLETAGKKMATGSKDAQQKIASYDKTQLSNDMKNARNYITNTSEKALKEIENRKKELEEGSAAATFRSVSTTLGNYGRSALGSGSDLVHFFTGSGVKAPEAHHQGEPAEESKQADESFKKISSGIGEEYPSILFRSESNRKRGDVHGGAAGRSLS